IEVLEGGAISREGEQQHEEHKIEDQKSARYHRGQHVESFTNCDPLRSRLRVRERFAQDQPEKCAAKRLDADGIDDRKNKKAYSARQEFGEGPKRDKKGQA